LKKTSSIRRYLVGILLIFVFLILGLIYLFQTVFIDDFYKASKIANIEETAHSIVNNIENDNLESVLESHTLNNEVCVRIVSRNINIAGFNQASACALRRIDNGTIMDISRKTEEAGGKRLFSNVRLMMSPETVLDLYIYSEMVDYEDERVMVLVSSIVTPLAATIQTIRDQYIVIAAVVIAATLLLAVLLSRFLIAPLKLMEAEAHNLPGGNYEHNIIKTDIKELSSLNQTLEEANEEIRKVDKTRKELIANVSHDLRTPLTMIVGYGEMMKDIPEEMNGENIDVIIAEARRLSSLVDDLIDISRMENAGIDFDKKEVDLEVF